MKPLTKITLEIGVVVGAMIAFPVAKPYIVYCLIARNIATRGKLPKPRTIRKASTIMSKGVA